MLFHSTTDRGNSQDLGYISTATTDPPHTIIWGCRRMTETVPKLRFNCYLLRPGLDSVTNALREQYRPGGKTEMIPLTAAANAPEGVSAYFRARSEKVPTWATALSSLFPGLNAALNTSNRLVIFLPVINRTFAVCFGYGSSTLDWAAIEPNFGLRFAARRLNADELNEIRSRRIDATSRTQSVQISAGTELRNFDVALEGEFVRKLVGELDTDGLLFEGLGAIVATDSVAFKVETDLDRVADVLGMMLREVSERHAKDELLFVDSLEPLRSNSAIVEQLEILLASTVFEGMSTGLATRLDDTKMAGLDQYVLEFSPPDGISIEDVDYIEVNRGTRSQGDSVHVLDSMSFAGLRITLADFGRNFGKSGLKIVKLMARGHDGEPASQMQPLKNWLVFEAGDGVRRYILTLGRWFALNEDYTERLNRDLAEIDIVTETLRLPSWDARMHEGPYNLRVATERSDLICLDTVDVRAGDGDEVEACDLFHEDGYLIHVKRYNGSPTLSQLFSQGSVSAQLIAGDVVYRKGFVAAVTERNTSFVSMARSAPQMVTYAIGCTKDRRLPEDLPSFSKVNLRDFAKRLRGSKVRPTLCRIQIAE